MLKQVPVWTKIVKTDEENINEENTNSIYFGAYVSVMSSVYPW